MHSGEVNKSFDAASPVVRWNLNRTNSLQVILQPVLTEEEAEAESIVAADSAFLFASSKGKVLGVNNSNLFVRDDLLQELSENLNSFILMLLGAFIEFQKTNKLEDLNGVFKTEINEDKKVFEESENLVAHLEMILDGYSVEEQDAAMKQIMDGSFN